MKNKYDYILELITHGECDKVEFKSSFQKDIFKAIVAFSNSKGGKIIRRIEKWDYPIKALREALLNAVVHRDYRDLSDIQIKIYDDKIVINNPGKLYGDLTLEDLKQPNYQSRLRNKLVAEAFYLTGNTEKYGTGFIRIKNELKSYPNNSYEFREIAGGMQIIFYKNLCSVTDNVVDKVVDKVVDDLTQNQQMLIKIIRQNQYISARELAIEIGISQRKIQKYIAKLKELGIVNRIGSPKGGYWEILKY